VLLDENEDITEDGDTPQVCVFASATANSRMSARMWNLDRQNHPLFSIEAEYQAEHRLLGAHVIKSAALEVGSGRAVALCRRPSTSRQICSEVRCLRS
jgi:hypothetical protein